MAAHSGSRFSDPGATRSTVSLSPWCPAAEGNTTTETANDAHDARRVNAAQLAPARRDPPPVVVEAQVVTRDRTPLTVSAGRGRSAPVRAGARTPAARNVALPTVPRVLTVPRVPTVLEVLTVPEVPIAPGVLTVPAVPTSAPATTGLNGATGPAGPNRRLPTATPHWRR